MSVPNYSTTVQAVYNGGHYDLTTKIGCGRFTEDVVWTLNQGDHRFGHLKKPNSLGGANSWNHHAVDNVCYLDSMAGRATAVDIIAAGESTSAQLTWSPDQEHRYLALDWYAPTGPDAFQMQPHGCRLGASLFYLMAAVHDPSGVLHSRAEANLTWIKETLNADYIRMFVTVGGKQYQSASGSADPWQYAGSFVSWPDLKATCERAIDWAFDHGLTVAPTLVGEGAQFSTEGQLLDLADLVADVVKTRRQKIELLEAWNEYSITGGTATLCRSIASRLRSRLGSEFPIALDTPQSAMTAPVGEETDQLPAEVSTFYGGSAANVITPQWDRSQPNPRDMGSAAPRLRYSHEPRGPGASAGGDVSDWLPLSNDYIQSALSGYQGHLLHASAGIFGGMCHEYWPRENQYPNYADHPNMAAIAQTLRQVKAGQNPNPSPPVEPPVPTVPTYDESWISGTAIPTFSQAYADAGVPVDPGIGVWVARVQYRTDSGQTQTEALPIVLAELKAALPH